MEELQQREWDEVQSSTWDLLRRRKHILRSRHRPVLQYLTMPSFADTWCIDVLRTGDDLAAYRTVWWMTRDVEAFATAIERLKHPRPFIPTLESTLLNVSGDRLDSLMSAVRGIALPLTPIRNAISLDGTSFEFQIGDGWTGVLLRWQDEFPDEWPSELQDVVSSLGALEHQPTMHASEQNVGPKSR